MKLPNFRRIVLEDFSEDEQELVNKLAAVLNIDIETLYIGLSNRLTFVENFDCTVKTFQVEVNANGVPKRNTVAQLNVINNTTPKASGSQVIKADNLSNGSFPTGGPFLTFTQNREFVTITHVAGIQPNTTYELTAIFYH